MLYEVITREDDRVVIAVRERRPNFLSVDLPAALDLRCARAHRSEIGARIRLAHADREEDLAAHDARQEGRPLRLGAEAQQQRPALPVGDPVRRDSYNFV